MSNGPMVKDVECLLLNKQKCRRRQPGELPYPITYCKGLADFDIWDHMFRISYCKSLTVHQFTEPPALTLDLGCGSGFWAIEAAKQWQDSTVIGFDVAEIQPCLSSIENLKPLSRRITWVNGNFLEGLPFPSDRFDFVRIAGIGLAVPEDEWQSVLAEVYRVLKPGAVLEIIEEDLLFPTPSSQLQKPKCLTLSPTPHLTESPIFFQSPKLLKKTSTTFSSKSNVSSERTRVSPDSSTISITETTSSKSNSKITNLLPLLYNLLQPSTATLTPAHSISIESLLEPEHPQDHTRLKTAWDSMLAARFLSPNLLSVLPFYLISASFSIKVHPPVLVPLPPNSGASPSLKSVQSMGSLRKSDCLSRPVFGFQSDRCIKTDGCSVQTSFTSGARPPPPPWGTMHLAKVTSVIRSCKETLRSEYNKLYSADALNILARTAPNKEDYASKSHDYVVHKAFEVDWNNWDYDMTDRMQMRKNLFVHTAWAQKPSGDQPPSQNWRENLDRKDNSDNNSPHLVTAWNPNDLCRSIRAFTATKS